MDHILGVLFFFVLYYIILSYSVNFYLFYDCFDTVNYFVEVQCAVLNQPCILCKPHLVTIYYSFYVLLNSAC